MSEVAEVTRYRSDAQNPFRTQRFKAVRQIIRAHLENAAECSVLDLGGTPEYWRLLASDFDWARVKLTIVNLREAPSDGPFADVQVGDARSLPQFSDQSFDVVHSNSVIEHVGRWEDMQSMAREVRRLGRRYFVQTPYFWFPLEPHARTPFLHWLPESMRYRLVMARKCGFWEKASSVGEAMTTVQSAVMLDKAQFRFLFPEASIVTEYAYGMPKSLMAIR